MRTRPYKLAVFDVDGTLTREPSVWEYLHKKLGIWESEGLPNLKGFLKNDFDYNEFARRDAEGYKGYSYDRLSALVNSIPRREGIAACFDGLRGMGLTIALLSTGLDILLDAIPGADIRLANELIFEDGLCTGKVRVNIPIYEKYAAYKSLLARMNILPCQVIVAGDSEGDMEMMQAADLAIAVAPVSDSVAEAATFCIDGDDLSVIHGLVQQRMLLR
jgi:phosphoserine phosphatase